MVRLTIMVDIHAQPDRLGLVNAELERLIPITRADKGCLQHDLYQMHMSTLTLPPVTRRPRTPSRNSH